MTQDLPAETQHTDARSAPPHRPWWQAPWLSRTILLIIVLLGGFLRSKSLYTWDGGTSQHPDERLYARVTADMRLPDSFGSYLDAAHSPANPHNIIEDHQIFVYGTLPPLLTRTVAVMLTPPPDESPTTNDTPPSDTGTSNSNEERHIPRLPPPLLHALNPDGKDMTAYNQIITIGRSLAVLFDMVSILLVYLIARQLWDRRTGLLAALLIALTVLHIQHAHFFVDPAFSTCFALLALYWAVRGAQRGDVFSFALLGVSIGAAAATRITLATLGVVALVAAVLVAVQARNTQPDMPETIPRPSFWKLFVWRSVPLLMLVGVLMLLTFRMLHPYLFIGSHPHSPIIPGASDSADWMHGLGFFDVRLEPRAFQDLDLIKRMQNGSVDYPPSFQWVNRTPYIYPLTNLVVWGMGIPAGVAAVLGWLIAGFWYIRLQPERLPLASLVVWLWVGVYVLWQGGRCAATMHSMLPITGPLLIFGAWLLVRLADSMLPAGLERIRRLLYTNHIRAFRLIPLLPLIIVVVGTVGWAYAFTRIYTRPHTRVMASQWLLHSIYPGAHIADEWWDDRLPLRFMPNFPWHDDIKNVTLSTYARDVPDKYLGDPTNGVPGLLDQLETVDFITLTSSRVYGSVQQVPMRYPATIRFYDALFSGKLGFTLVADITSYPSLLSFTIPDQGAEESFHVYDHPRVLIFRKTHFSREQAERLIIDETNWDEVYTLPIDAANQAPTALRLTTSEWPRYHSGGTWSAMFHPRSIVNMLAPLIWLLVLEIIGLAMFALLFRLLPRLPDRGFSLARSIGLLIVAYSAWLGGSMHMVPFTPRSVWLCALPLLVAGGLVGWRERAAIGAFMRARRGTLLLAYAIYLLAFGAMLTIRWLNPDLWHPWRGGEKPMEFAYLNAILQSSAFPPYDPWFAGGIINYYYFGFVIVGTLIHLTTIVPSIAFNLAVPTIFALTALGAWGVVYNLVAPATTPLVPVHIREIKRGVGVPTPTEIRLWQSPKNDCPTCEQVPPLEYVNRKECQERKEGTVGEATGHEPDKPLESGVDSRLTASIVQQEWRARLSGILAPIGMLILGNLAQATWFFNGYAAQQEHRPEWAFWDATRIVEWTINEFPFFTFLFADMHPHMIVMPFSLALLGVCVALVRHASVYLPAKIRRFPDPALLKDQASALLSYLLVLVLMGLLVGTLRATNTWDYPTYVGLTIVTLGLVYGDRYRRARNLASYQVRVKTWTRAKTQRAQRSDKDRTVCIIVHPYLVSHDTLHTTHTTQRVGSRTTVPLFWRTLLSFVLAATFVIILGNLFFMPFTSHFATESSGIELLRDTSQSELVAQVWSAERTTVREELTLYGMWLFILVSAAVALMFRWLRITIWVTAVLALSIGILVVATATNNTSAPVLLIPLVLGAGVLLWYMRHLPPRIVLPLWWGAMALAICLGVELVFVRGDVGRMNTVFKFGLHAWTLFALTAAIAIPWIWSASVRMLSRSHWILAIAQWAWRGALIVLCVAALFYPVTATPSRIEDRYSKEVPPTLDGIAFMPYVEGHENEHTFPLIEDYQAIRWFQEHATGTPIILEAHQPAYRWGARIATFTGLPTLLGWEWHQIQQRSVVLQQALLTWEQAPLAYAIDARTAIERRKDTVAYIFNTTDVLGALDKIRSYGIEYIYVGGVEHALYDPAGLAKFNDLADMGYLARAFQFGATTIYRVVTPGTPSLLTLDAKLEPPHDVRTPPPLMLDQPVNTLPPVPGYAWNTWANGHSWNAVLVWLIALSVLAITGFPLTLVVFRRWQDGGIVWARLLSLMIIGYAVWLPTSLHITHNSLWNLAGGCLVILMLDIAALVWLGRTANSDGSTHRSIRSLLASGMQVICSFIQHHRRQLILSESLFLVGFACFTLIRAFNPDLWHPVWGGEKPMEMGFLNAVIRSPVMSPYTPFFSDGFINYYYYGFFLVSLLIKATGIAPAIAFNLIVPTLFAMTLSGAYAIVRHITGRVRYGLIGAAFLAVLGNLASVLRVGWAQGISPVISILFNANDPTPFLDRLLNLGPRLGDWYVGPSRIIIDQSFTINEFPYWSYLFADLHPHIIALPMTLLVIALAYHVLRGDTSLPLYGTIALSLGTLAVTNSWDFPTYTLLIMAMLAGHAWRHGDYPLMVRLARVIGACILAGVLAAGGMALYTPFFDHYYPMVSGIGQVRDTTSIRDYLVIYGVYLAILVPLFLGAAWRMMAMRVDTSRRRPAQTHVSQQHSDDDTGTDTDSQPDMDTDANADMPDSHKDVKQIQLITRADRIIVIVGRLALVLLLVVLARTAMLDAFMGLRMWLVALLLIGSGLLIPRRTPAPTWFVFVLTLLAWSISLGIDTIFIRDHLAEGEAYRMNTVFKFGMHIWTLLSLGAAIGLPIFLRGLERAGKKLVRVAQHTRGGMHALKAQRTGGLVVQTIGIMALGPLVLMAAMFPLIGTPSRIANRFDGSPSLTLDGLAFLRYAAFNHEGTIVYLAPDADGIAWLNANLSGTPIVAQSGLFFYRMYGIRVAASTGFPSIVSSLHENEQRDPGIVGMRDGDLETLYRTTDLTVARDIVTKYRVDYIYVGSIERAFYPAEGLAKFATTLAPMLEVVFEQPGVTIYKVLDTQVSQTYEREDVPESQLAPTLLPTQPATGDIVIPEDTAELANMVADDPTNSLLAIELAQRYRHANQLDDALLVVDTALRANPNDSVLFMVRGDILVEIGRFDEAEQAHQSAAMLSGASADWTKLGSELLRWNKPDKAEIALIRAIMSEPVDSEAYYHLAQVYLLQGEQDTARKHLSIYVQQRPDGPFAAEARNLLEAVDNGD